MVKKLCDDGSNELPPRAKCIIIKYGLKISKLNKNQEKKAMCEDKSVCIHAGVHDGVYQWEKK